MSTTTITSAYFERFETPKYRNKNPVQRALIRRFVTTVHGLFQQALPAASVLEVGVGEGFLSGFLSERYASIEFSGTDLNPDDIARLGRLFPRVNARAESIYDLETSAAPSDIVLCCEVLEHVDDPARALRALRRVTKQHAILSVPHEPFFMLSNLARGKNVRRFGNDPEHVNHWGAGSFRKFVEQAFVVERLQLTFPWVAVLARPR